MKKISRRDFINGTLMVAGASMLPFGCTGKAVLDLLDPSYYPPALTGLRGDNPGSYTSAHNRAWADQSDWGSTTKLKEEYDLIVKEKGTGAKPTLISKILTIIQDLKGGKK